ncbi:MAG: type II toxin-antitoxin system RelE/ParE family toxin [Azospirillaceae bacterium]|nr:type II toxin-antitoxin system RelE/ParE family toxin [Azospirillaceae bacterium]
MYRVVFTRAANADIIDAFGWYAQHVPGMIPHLKQELRLIQQRISENPMQFPACANDIRRALTRRFPYFVVFRTRGDAVYILAFLHTSRDPAVWQGR